ncbi:hypothetical protein ES332_A12G214300v1 [Gossypium tomentosum]|uniref:galactinol--sucrose galactosyltransferase n=1 Tax=Gossypium tomentosum TaxID=34277 RepID=A0A5D2MZT5_GOSTO|nr:hypothetical protein ES332_A12G214300v1 [Gossypium tomentosum]
MTITAAPCVNDGCLMVRGKVVLTHVPTNIILSPGISGAAFLGSTSPIPTSRHVFTLGILEGYKHLCLYRFKIWWMIPGYGKSGSEIPLETQLLLLEIKEESVVEDDDSSGPPTPTTFYVLFLPVLDGDFRTSLQGTPANELQFCAESGDANVQNSQILEPVFINSGDNPFELIKNSIKILEKHKGTFRHIENKKIPAHLDWFGWCTWDAFYTEVNPQGIKEGLQSFSDGGCSPRFATRLVDIKENSKFKSSESDAWCNNLHEFINMIKGKFGSKYVYVWHALTGYWGGVLPSSETMKKYSPKIVYPIQSPGNIGNLRDIIPDSLEKYGVGIIDPQKIFDFYNDLHSYLSSNGVDGVKVDAQNFIETLGSGFGGRVLLTRRYQQALEQSTSRNFKDNNLICCMSHNSDSIYSWKISAVARASEDFMPREPTFQTLHIASVAFNSLLLGEIVVPDWDMFHSKHDTAEFHGIARAIGGCAVYVSDKPGNHDFEILRKLVLPDGSVLRAKHAGRPTRDCLFRDPVMDGKSLLKIWNLNKLSGVVGVFNCQGAGSWPLKQTIKDMPSTPLVISGNVSPCDVEFIEDVAGENWNGDFAVYAFNSGSLSRLPMNGNIKVTLATLKCETFTISPIRVSGEGVHFAPIGLLDMYNSGGAVESIDENMKNSSEFIIKIKVRGCGRFGVYTSLKPSSCIVDMEEEEFIYNSENGLLTLDLTGDCNFRDIEFIY